MVYENFQNFWNIAERFLYLERVERGKGYKWEGISGDWDKTTFPNF